MTDGTRPRALYLLAHGPFPPASGGSRRAVTIAAALAASHDVTILAADTPEGPVAGWAAASARFAARRRSHVRVAQDAVEGIVRGEHGLLVRSVRAGMPDVVAAWLREARPALVVLGRPLLAPYIRAAHSAGALVVVDVDERLRKIAWAIARSRTTPPVTRLRFAIEALAVVGRMERAAYPHADQLWVSSEDELSGLAREADPRRIVVVPNAVPVGPETPRAPEPAAVGFLGWYGYPPNEAAALELIRSIMPAVRASGGPRRLVLIGAQPTQAMRTAAAAAGDVETTGLVPDARASLRDAGMLVVPLRSAGGTRIKILDAAAAGVPVISTALGASGLGMTPGVHFLAAETTAEFAARIVELAADAGLRQRLVDAAHALVRERHSLDAARASVDAGLAALG